MSARTSKVNLVPLSEFESGFWGSFLRWAVTTGRYLIILTELVVIVAFLMRFKLDEDLRNLNEQINGQVALLQSQEKKEEQFRQLQTKIKLADRMLGQKVEAVEMLGYVKARIPDDTVIKKIETSLGQIKVTATTFSQKSMSSFMATVSADPKWKSVEVTQLTGDRKEGITYTVVMREE